MTAYDHLVASAATLEPDDIEGLIAALAALLAERRRQDAAAAEQG